MTLETGNYKINKKFKFAFIKNFIFKKKFKTILKKIFNNPKKDCFNTFGFRTERFGAFFAYISVRVKTWHSVNKAIDWNKQF